MCDDEIISLYFRRDEQAIRESMDAYGSYCEKIAGNILRHKEDAEEAVADTWLHAWQKIPPTRPGCLRLFFGRITRNLALDLWRKNSAERRGSGEITLALDELAECVGEDKNPELLAQTMELGRSVNEFLRAERDNSRVIFLRR